MDFAWAADAQGFCTTEFKYAYVDRSTNIREGSLEEHLKPMRWYNLTDMQAARIHRGEN